jgi:hypothetical protein
MGMSHTSPGREPKTTIRAGDVSPVRQSTYEMENSTQTRAGKARESRKTTYLRNILIKAGCAGPQGKTTQRKSQKHDRQERLEPTSISMH